MQTTSPKHTLESLQVPARPSVAGRTNVVGNRARRNHTSSSNSPRLRPSCTCSNGRPGSVKCSLHGYALPGDNKLRRHQAKKEILRRALTPPNRKPTLRWWNFRPTPSRLSNMSMD